VTAVHKGRISLKKQQVRKRSAVLKQMISDITFFQYNIIKLSGVLLEACVLKDESESKLSLF
jgi:hypothetical protein